MTTSSFADSAAHGQDNDLLICELQHRVEELLADNDAMRSELWAKDVTLRVLAEKIDDLERVK